MAINEAITASDAKKPVIQMRGRVAGKYFQKDFFVGEVSIGVFMYDLLIAVKHLHRGLCFWVGAESHGSHAINVFDVSWFRRPRLIWV